MSHRAAPLITVGLPVWNAMPYLPEAMESLLAQSYSDFEILAIDDGSTDASLDYLLSIRDSRLRVISQENHGLTAVLNRMLNEVSSPWLARHDADDVAYPQRLARTVQQIKERPDAGMFYSLAEYYPATSVGEFRCTKGAPGEIRDLVLSGYLPAICHPSVTLNVAKAKELGGYRFNLFVEDIDLWWRMALYHEICFIPEVMVGFRQNLQSISSKNLTDQAVSGLFIQYLLLSSLRKMQPRGFDEVRPTLLRMLDSQRLRFKVCMRAFNIEMGKGNVRRAAYQAGRAFAASPRSFFSRLLDELASGKKVFGGEDPALFDIHAEKLWPMQSTPISQQSHTFAFASSQSRESDQ